MGRKIGGIMGHDVRDMLRRWVEIKIIESVDR
jgi:hypothetical protein